MSYVTGTTHYNLPQTVGTDKRDWADTNQAFADIDSAIYGAVEDVATAATDISGIKDRLDTAEGDITQLQSDVSGIDGRLTTAEQTIVSQGNKIDDVKSDTQDMICAYSEPTATSTHNYAIGDYFRYNDVLYRATQIIAIGDTIVPDTNCTTTNVTAELLNSDSSLDSLSDRVSTVESAVESLPKTTVTKNGLSELRSYLDTLTADKLCNTVIHDTTNGHVFHCSLINWNTVTYMFSCLAIDSTANLIRIRTISNASYWNSTVYHDNTTVNNAALSIEAYTGTDDVFKVITTH